MRGWPWDLFDQECFFEGVINEWDPFWEGGDQA